MVFCPQYKAEYFWPFAIFPRIFSFYGYFVLRSPTNSVKFYFRTTWFLSDFTSEPPNFCLILPWNHQVSVRFYLRRTQFMSDFTTESFSFSQILLQRLPSFSQILCQNPLVSVRLYQRSLQFLSDYSSVLLSFYQILPLEPVILSDFTSEPPSSCQILAQNPLGSV